MHCEGIKISESGLVRNDHDADKWVLLVLPGKLSPLGSDYLKVFIAFRGRFLKTRHNKDFAQKLSGL